MFVVRAAETGGGGGDGDGKGRDARWIRPIRAHVTRPGLRMGLRMGLGLAHLDPSRSSPRSPASLPAPSHLSPREILHESEGREEIHGPRRSHAPFPSFLGRRFEDACYWTYVDRYQQHVFTSPSSHHHTDVVALRLSFSPPSSMFTPLPTATLVLRDYQGSLRVPLPRVYSIPGYLDLPQTRVPHLLPRPPVVGVHADPPADLRTTHLAHFASPVTHNTHGITPAWTTSSRSTQAERGLDVQDRPPQWVVLRRR
ncbi:hypothetical protein EDB84DRAFT_1494670 [Lactarius hengduanensis]|nr:hypothetical protein EDB84DRAFT_1494670 [Lactarius hengduanensis]